MAKRKDRPEKTEGSNADCRLPTAHSLPHLPRSEASFMEDHLAKLAIEQTRLIRRWVAMVGIERAREGANRALESAKSYPPGNWIGTSLREIGEEMLEIVEAYRVAGWISPDRGSREVPEGISPGNQP
jgi:hypothetical protein